MNKTVLIMGGALVVAVVVALFFQMNMKNPKTAAPAAPKLEVLVASKILPKGKKLATGDVQWKVWPEDMVYKGLIKKSDQKDPNDLSYYGSPVRYDIEIGQPVTTGAIITGKGGQLSAYIAPGMRAATINVKADSNVGGFVMPDDHVDVIMAYTPKLVGAAQDSYPELIQRQATQLILSDVKVLAVDQDTKTEKAKVSRTVTLEVTPEGAHRLALAIQMGNLYLSLRRMGEEDDPAAKKLVPLVTDVSVSQVMQKINAHAGQRDTDGPKVRLYSGNSIYNVPVRPTQSP